MKKVFVSLVLISLLVSVSFAAAKTSVPLILSSDSVKPSNSLRIGLMSQAAPGGFGTIITGGMRFNPAISGDLGIAYGTNAAGANSNIGLLGRLEFDLLKIGDVMAKAGGNLMIATNPAYAAAATSSITINGFVGVEYALLSNLSVLADLTVLEFSTAGGVSTFGIGSGTAAGTGLGASSALFYSGARLYL
ncbi:hypothetical protein HZC34_05830 [Candidatus Saganbacteria bacterium]|nr:hypothetical protein [Candidatus Saganbacteria bacterium]